MRGPDRHSGLGDGGQLIGFGDPQVEQLGSTVATEKDVPRLDIPVSHPLLMKIAQGRSNRPHDFSCPGAVERAGGKLGSITYLQGRYDVIAEVEVDSVETAAGMRDVMLMSGAWDELMLMPEFDLDKAVAAAKAVDTYPMPGKE